MAILIGDKWLILSNHTTYEKSRIYLVQSCDAFFRLFQCTKSIFFHDFSPEAEIWKIPSPFPKKVLCYRKLREYNSRFWQFYMRVLSAIIYSSYKIYVHFMLTHKITLILDDRFAYRTLFKHV